MRKSTVVKLFVGSLVGMAAAVVLFVVAGLLALGNDVLLRDGPDVVGIKAGPFGWTMLGLAVVAVLGMVAAVAAQLVAWVGAVVNTAQLPDKTWFIVVLVGGLVSLGFLATLAYVIGGADGEQPVTGGLELPLDSATTGPEAELNRRRAPGLVHHE
ncbi:MAG: hypothetical protein M3Y71_09555 [Actinomycetota bacterium]|nr:hypothetical protein [Actinomycetota bacterium]